VDTVAPQVSGVTARRREDGIEIRGAAADEASPIRRIEASVDGGPYRALPPADGLLDGREEGFAGRVPLEPGQQGSWIVVRVQDEAGNRGTYRVWLEAAQPQ
jgi:hypothetical protein